MSKCCDMSERICIATWGNPQNWEDVNYVLDEDSDYGKTSLKLLQRKIEPDMTVLIGLDTLARRGSSYEEVRESAEGIYRNYLEKFGLTVDKIIIAPGVGEFKEKVDGIDINKIFIGEMSDFYSYILHELEEILPIEDLEVHLDLTHGINFMPVLTYRAVMELVEIIPKKVKLFVYNSDPFSKGVGRLRINRVESSEIPWRPNFIKLSNSMELLRPIDLNESEKEKLFKYELKEYKGAKKGIKELNAFIGSIVNGLPLALFTFYPEIELLDRCIEETMKIYNNYVEVSDEKMGIRVKRRLSFGRDFPSLIKLRLIARALRELGVERKSEVELAELNELREKLFQRNERMNAMISYDLNEIEEKVGQAADWRKLKEFLGYKGNYDHRNFLAHSGLERNAVEVKRENDKILLKYCEDLIKRVKEDSARGLLSWGQ